MIQTSAMTEPQHGWFFAHTMKTCVLVRDGVQSIKFCKRFQKEERKQSHPVVFKMASRLFSNRPAWWNSSQWETGDGMCCPMMPIAHSMTTWRLDCLYNISRLFSVYEIGVMFWKQSPLLAWTWLYLFPFGLTMHSIVPSMEWAEQRAQASSDVEAEAPGSGLFQRKRKQKQ